MVWGFSVKEIREESLKRGLTAEESARLEV
jgi:hypothetical protein